MSLLDLDERMNVTIGDEYEFRTVAHISYTRIKRRGTTDETKSSILEFINNVNLEEVFLLKGFLYEDDVQNAEVKTISYVDENNDNIMFILMNVNGACVLMVKYCKK